jgi:hypothetical protein
VEVGGNEGEGVWVWERVLACNSDFQILSFDTESDNGNK